MAILDKGRGGYRVFVGDLGSRVGKYDLERECQSYGPILDVWVARFVITYKIHSVTQFRFPSRFVF
jgi:hypothetical protein